MSATIVETKSQIDWCRILTHYTIRCRRALRFVILFTSVTFGIIRVFKTRAADKWKIGQIRDKLLRRRNLPRHRRRARPSESTRRIPIEKIIRRKLYDCLRVYVRRLRHRSYCTTAGVFHVRAAAGRSNGRGNSEVSFSFSTPSAGHAYRDLGASRRVFV